MNVGETVGGEVEIQNFVVDTAPQTACRCGFDVAEAFGVGACLVVDLRADVFEFVAVKAVQTVPCGKPQDSVTVFGNLLDLTLRQTVVFIIVSDMAKRSRGKGGNYGCKNQKSDE